MFRFQVAVPHGVDDLAVQGVKFIPYFLECAFPRRIGVFSRQHHKDVVFQAVARYRPNQDRLFQRSSKSSQMAPLAAALQNPDNRVVFGAKEYLLSGSLNVKHIGVRRGVVHIEGKHLNILKYAQLLPGLIGLHPFYHRQALFHGDVGQTGDKDLQKLLCHGTDIHKHVIGDLFIKPVVVAVGVGEQQPRCRTAIKDFGYKHTVPDGRIGIGQIGS